MDLNSLIPADSPLYLIYALGINDAGEIVGLALQTATGDLHAYLAIPIHGAASSSGKAHETLSSPDDRPRDLPANVRLQLQQRLPRLPRK